MKHLPDSPALVDEWASLTPSQRATLSDADLLRHHEHFAERRRAADIGLAETAALIAHRSRPELGYDGLAQRTGARTPELLIQKVSGLGRREASTMVRVGGLLDAEPETPGAPPKPQWQVALGDAVRETKLSAEAARLIRGALDGLELPEDVLLEAARELLQDAVSLTETQLAARARQVRDRLDEAGIAQREEGLREKRCLNLYPLPDGSMRISGVLDPESAAIVVTAIDAATSPRRGGPRFVDPASRDRAQRLIDDPRSTPQIALDALVELVKLGVAVDSAHIVGVHKPTVRLHVTASDLDRRAGTAHFEGQTGSVSVATAERHVCADGFVPILFDKHGEQVMNVGRDERFFTYRQRIGLAARDGGCRFPDCDRPPSWTEAHHINEWDRHHGRTDIADGVLLCRHHHMLVHNNGWRVTRTGADYFVVTPASLDPEERPIPAPPKGVWSARAA
ncbi:MAG: endonuclease [Microbacteriaceae bacterium]|nr:endonuclease [Microbacteriaceae bacterium]